MMVDPVLNFMNALWLIYQRLPLPFTNLLFISFVFSSLIVFVRLLFDIW